MTWIDRVGLKEAFHVLTHGISYVISHLKIPYLIRIIVMLILVTLLAFIHAVSAQGFKIQSKSMLVHQQENSYNITDHRRPITNVQNIVPKL